MTTKVMVVDDEPAIGKLLIYQLRGFGYEVDYVQDGLLALRQFLLARPDLILLDVMMPQISGWELCRQIRACSSVPVIMLTAKGADPDVVNGLDAGADDYVIKPFSMTQLHARIEAVLRRAEHAQERSETRPGPKSDPHLAALVNAYQVQAAASAMPAQPQLAGPQLRVGDQLREARQTRGLSLHQVERVCKIRWEFLQAIEQENWSYVPRTQLRPALKVYSAYLGLDLNELLGRKLALPAIPTRPLFPMPLAAMMAVVVLLLVVGLYLLSNGRI